MGGVFYRSVVWKIVALAFAVTLSAGCSSMYLSVAYSPQGILADTHRPGEPIALTVVDRIHNTAPLSTLRIMGIQRTAPGAQLICDTCTYQFATPPVELVRQIVGEVLARQGTPLASAAVKRAEVQIHQFEFYLTKGANGVGLQVEGRVGLELILTAPEGVVVDRSLIEAAATDPDSSVGVGDLQDLVSRTVSAAVERVLSDPKMFSALTFRER